MSYPGLLGFITEANEIKEALGVSVDEAFDIQRERANARLAAAMEAVEIEQAAAESNVIPFRAKH
jgi:hypothetical protein